MCCILDNISMFLLNAADWIALVVGHIYHEVKKQKQILMDEAMGKLRTSSQAPSMTSSVSCPAMFTSPKPSVYTRPFTSVAILKAVSKKRSRNGRNSNYCSRCWASKSSNLNASRPMSCETYGSRKSLSKFSSDRLKEQELAKGKNKGPKRHKSCCCWSKTSKHVVSKPHSSADFYRKTK